MLRYAQTLRCVRLFAMPWTIAHQAPLSMGFPRQEYWSGVPFASPGIDSVSPALAGGFFTPEPAGKPLYILPCFKIGDYNFKDQMQLKNYTAIQFWNTLPLYFHTLWGGIKCFTDHPSCKSRWKSREKSDRHKATKIPHWQSLSLKFIPNPEW